MTLAAADGPEDRPPGWEQWWHTLRLQRNQWTHSSKTGSPLDLIWASARSANYELTWRELSEALLLFDLTEVDRPSHVGALAQQLAIGAGAARVLDPFCVAPALLAPEPLDLGGPRLAFVPRSGHHDSIAR